MLRLLFAGVAALLVGITLARVFVSYASGSQLNHASGVWMAHALDLTHGVLYRPLYSEEWGTGGSRYMPLYFALQAGLIRLGLGPLLSGFVLSWLAGLALLAGVYRILRAQRLPADVAGFFALAVLADGSFQYAITTVRGDLLATALTVWGLVLVSKSRGGAAAFYTLALATKLTSLGGLLSSLAAALQAKDFRQASALLGGAVLGQFLLGGLLVLGSGGRILEIASTCFGANATFSDLWHAPSEMYQSILSGDPQILAFLAFALLLACWQPCENAVVAWFFWITLALTVLIFASPGADYNHLVDLHVAIVLRLGCSARTSERSWATLALALSGLHLLALSFILTTLLTVDSGASRLEEMAAVPRVVPGPGLLFSEDPMIPILGREPVVLLDPFMLRIVGLRRPQLLDPLEARLRRKDFRALVLKRNPIRDPGWFRDLHLGPRVLEAILENYQFFRTVGGYAIFLPSNGRSSRSDFSRP